MEQLIVALFTLLTSIADVPAAEALVATARDTHLTIDTAVQHVAAARFAAILTDTDPDLLLAIAHHETRYEPHVIVPLVRGKHACGVMQHVPITGECPAPSIFRDYVDGATHLAEWMRAQHGDIARALIADGSTLLIRLHCAIAAKHRERA